MNGVNRFAIAILMMLSGYWTVVAQQQASDPDKKNAVLVSGGAFMVSQKGLAPERVAEFRPAMDVFYHRMLWNRFGIGVGYAYSESDPNYWHVIHPDDVNNVKIDCIQQSHSCFIASDYSLNFNRFYVNPYVAMGVCWTKFTINRGEDKTDRQTCFILSPGIRMGYNIDNWLLFASYHFDYCFSQTYFPYIIIAQGVVTHCRGHHCLNLGVGYLF